MNAETPNPTSPAPASRNSLRWMLMGAGTVLALVIVLWLYLTSGRYMSTDDASINAAQTAISAHIAGQVVNVAVHDNQHVHRGDLLFQLDDQPLRIALKEAEAKLALARMQISAAKSAYRHQLAETDVARGTLAYQRHELERQQHLAQSGITSHAQLDQTQHSADEAQQNVAAEEQQAGSYLAVLGGTPDAPLEAHPMVMQAQAALDKAKLDLTYTSVFAPDDGVVTKVEQLQVGNYISPAVELFTLVSTRNVWIDANFKEDQLAHMRPGQSAEVTIDAYPDRRFKARVVSLSPGTGSQFSVLPAENATGNWVKVVQRLPVRLEFTDKPDDIVEAMHAGLSANVSVDTQFHRHVFGRDSTQP
jgi:membrane fusion protein (multidrug efflux system)